MALGALAALAVTPSIPGGDRWAIALTAAGFGLVGLVEDVVGVPVLHRLVFQVVAGGFGALLLLDNLGGPAIWRCAFAVLVVIWLIAFVNGYNFMDGIDGISVVQAVIAGIAWLLVGTYVDDAVLACGGAIVAGAALGFAPFNVPRARMFLGDVGSYFLGAWLAALAVLGLRAGLPPEAALAPLAVYLADTGTTLARRVFRGERWYLPHREHAYQRLGAAGWSHIRVSVFVAACIAACGALGMVSLGDSVVLRIVADLGIAIVVVAYLLSPKWLTARTKARLSEPQMVRDLGLRSP
ncbi:MAG: UDP-GlcNAc:undecaprenyl-phosphate/decaprenyl-phosphate GlcNAc-phosphate transferase [Actinomycetota bacterium]|nr:UDP-GlcNAc:undecaprenyl-phosphate/decaprenyl-phosphate GlcNAc-phosphate transferase [Actinomycetota bacterium]